MPVDNLSSIPLFTQQTAEESTLLPGRNKCGVLADRATLPLITNWQFTPYLCLTGGSREGFSESKGEPDWENRGEANEELRRQYAICYYPANPGSAGERKQIQVRVDRPKLIVRSRDGYIVGKNTNGE